MRALSAAIAPVLASLLLMATVLAPAHCLARIAPQDERPAALCAPSSLFETAPPGQGHHQGVQHAGGICVVCAAYAASLPADPPLARPAPAAWQKVAFALPPARAPPHARSFEPGQPRAPPAA